MTVTDQPEDIAALAKGGRTNVAGFVLRLGARIPFLFIAGHMYGAALVGRFAIAVVVVEFAALIATLGLKRGLAQALSATDRPHNHVVFDALALALIASLIASVVLFAFPQAMYPNSAIGGLDRFFPLVILAPALSDVSLAALAYRHDVKASVTARAVIEPWTLSIFAFLFSFFTHKDGLVLAYVASMVAALTASIVPLIRSYGIPHGWSPQVGVLWQMTRANTPLAGADALEWGSRNVDRLILGTLFAPSVVGIYYMAQQVASLPQKLKTSFDPILGPVVTQSLARGDLAAIARQVAGGVLDHRGAAGAGDHRLDPARGCDGDDRAAVRRRRRTDGVPAVRGGLRLDRRGLRIGAGLYGATPQPADLDDDAGVADRAVVRADPRPARGGLWRDDAGGGRAGRADAGRAAHLVHQGRRAGAVAGGERLADALAAGVGGVRRGGGRRCIRAAAAGVALGTGLDRRRGDAGGVSVRDLALRVRPGRPRPVQQDAERRGGDAAQRGRVHPLRRAVIASLRAQ
jgi:hypothetical protein